jgi:nucleotide-binding universal stress UspA family protein
MRRVRGDEAIGAFRAAIDALAGDLSVTSVVCRGPAGPALEHVASEQNCDAIVIGRGSRRWRPWPGPASGTCDATFRCP